MCRSEKVIVRDLGELTSNPLFGKQCFANLIKENGQVIPVTLFENAQGVFASTRNSVLPLRENSHHLSEIQENDQFEVLEAIVRDND